MTKKLNKDVYFLFVGDDGQEFRIEVQMEMIKKALKEVEGKKGDLFYINFLCQDGQKIGGNISIKELKEVLKTYE